MYSSIIVSILVRVVLQVELCDRACKLSLCWVHILWTYYQSARNVAEQLVGYVQQYHHHVKPLEGLVLICCW